MEVPLCSRIRVVEVEDVAEDHVLHMCVKSFVVVVHSVISLQHCVCKSYLPTMLPWLAGLPAVGS